MIGKTYAAFCDFFVNIDTPENPYMQTEWRTHHEFPGGSISDAGIHWAAQLRCIFGDIEVKSAFAQGINPHIGKTDSVSFHFFNSRKLCGIANLFLSAKDYFKDGMVILGTEGSIVVDQVGTVFGNVKISTRHKGEATEEIIENDTGLVEEFTDFYQAIRTGTQVQSSFKEAYKDLKVILDALEASKSGDVASLMAFW
jgi:predicted dehydrogenase